MQLRQSEKLKQILSIMVKYRKPLEENILVRLLHIHAFAHLFRSLFKPIAREDLYDLRENHKPGVLIDQYDRLVNQSNAKKRGLKWVLFKMFKQDLVIGIIMSFVVALLIIESPLIMKKILVHISTPKVTSEQTKAVRGVIRFWLIVFIVKIFFNQFTERKFFIVGLRVQLLLTNLFMRKITRLSLNDTYQSKPEVMNYLIVEINKIEVFFKKGSWLFSQPPVLLLGLLMMSLKSLWLGLLALEIVLGFVVIRVLADNHMENCHHHKLEIQQKRTYTNVQLFKQIRELKTIGFQSLIPIKNLQYMQRENKYNIKYMMFKHLIEASLVLIPFVFFFVCFLLRLKQDPSVYKLSLVQAYIALIYVQILVSPLKNIRYIVNYLQDMISALDKLEQFLSLPEVQHLSYCNQDLPLAHLKFENVKVLREDIQNPNRSAGKSDPKYFMMEKITTVSSPGRRIKNFFQIPFQVELNPGDHMVVLGDHDEGSVLLSLIMGNVKLTEGNIEYNGKIAYVSSELWLVEGTIRDNVLMGQPQNIASLRLVYDITELLTDFDCSLPDGDQTMISSPNLTESHKRRITLARCIYIKADIYLFDSIFKGVSQKITQNVYNKLSVYLEDKTFLLVSKNLQLAQNDKVLVFASKPKAIEYGKFNKLRETEGSNIHKYTQQEFEQEVNLRMAEREHDVQHQDQQARQKLVPLSSYRQFLSYGSMRAAMALTVVVILIQLVKLYLDILLGHVHQSKKAGIEQSNIKYYLGILTTLFCMQVLSSLLEIYLSNKISKSFTKDLTKTLSTRTDMKQLEGRQQMSLIEMCSNDFEDIFLLVHRLPALISYLMTLFSTILLLLYCSPKLLPYILLLLAFNVVFFVLLLRTQREITRHKTLTLSLMHENVFAFIDGIQTVKHYADPKQFLIQRSTYVSDYAVYIQNQRFALHAIKMVSQITTLAITYWTMMFAVGKRSGLNKDNILGLFVAISYCLKLSGLIYYIIEETSEAESAMKKTVEKVLKIVNSPYQKQKSLAQPSQWNVNISNFASNGAHLENSPYNIRTLQKVGFVGQKTLISDINYSLTQTIPSPGSTQIEIGGIPLEQIAREAITSNVYHLTKMPFVFSSTVLENIDPLSQYKTTQVLSAIHNSGIPQLLFIPNETRCSEHQIVYETCGLSLRQAISLSRLLLRKPKLILNEISYPQTFRKQGQKSFKEAVSEATVIFSNPGESFKQLCQAEIKV